MKTIGLLGGMSWESTIPYYKLINEGIKNKLGGLHSAKIILYSVDFQEIEKCQSNGNWNKAGEILANAALSLQNAGADGIVLCTNTMHKVASSIESACNIPFLHIADSTGKEIVAKGLERVALIGTSYTMEQEFYKSRLKDKFGLEVITPNKEERDKINKIIFNELCLGDFKESSARYYLDVIDKLSKEGADGVIFGCTEIGLLVDEKLSPIRVFDTTKIHANDAVLFITS